MAELSAASLFEAAAEGAIAQLGERVVRNDEVGGSIPPGSTKLRPSVMRSVPGKAPRAKTDLTTLPPWRAIEILTPPLA